MAEEKISGTILRSADGSGYFISDAQLQEFRLSAEASSALEPWVKTGEAAGQASEELGVVGVIQLSTNDPGADAVRAVLDPLVGPSGYIRRCLNVVPADILDLVAEIDRQST